MDTQKADIPKISTANTKKEMLDAYKQLVRQLKEQAKDELKPEKVKEERQTRETVQAADTIASDSALQRLSNLKFAIDKQLSDLAAGLEEETNRYQQLKSAIEMKDREMKEIFEIEREAHTLAALLENQKKKKLEFEEDISAARAQWDREKQQYQDALKERKQEDEKNRKREKEEYEYNFKREQALQKAKLADELDVLKKEIQKKQADSDAAMAETESSLKQREKNVTEREQFIDGLEAKVNSFPKELETRIAKAVQTAETALEAENAKNEQLLTKGYEGEKNVLQTRIEALERTVAIQEKQIQLLNQQLEKAYEKVQEIAVKAVSRTSSTYSGNQGKPSQAVDSMG